MKNKNIFPVSIKKYSALWGKGLLLIVLSLLSTATFAIHEELRTQSSGSQIAADSVLRNRDPLMSVDLMDLDNALDPTWYSGINMYRVRNRIKLEVNPFITNACIPDTFTCSVTIRVLRLDKDYTLDSVEQTLTVTYNGGLGKVYNATDVFAFEGYHYTEVKILSVSCNSSITDFLLLKNEIDIDRYYDINLSTGPTVSSTTHNALTNEIEVSWTYHSGIVPEEYDLEWTFVDNYKDISTFFTASETEYNFKHNSTRISTTENSYKISAAFERGFLLFRVRAVGRTGEHYTYRVNGPWSTATDAGVVSSYPSGSRIEITSGIEHQATLNWQFSATYAEEGKKKEIISYFDGSLRNRQTVTKNNTDTTAIVAETIYDHQGRPAINTLPVPAAQNILKYFPDFNLNLSGDPYSRTDFDLDTGECSPEVSAMSINAGASKYYSVNNPYQSLSNHYKYVPDAFGFAFTQVEYMPDNTGRISRQSGVGEDHVLGSGHETKYLYSTPFQEELDRLFGNSVGYAEHYQKNMVTDANGQVSVSYLNLSGKTIATSLAGGSPNNVDSLASMVQPTSIKVSLQNSADTSYADGEITMSKTFTVSHLSNYSFEYSIEADTFDSDCLPSGVCLDCVYDLEITLTDICGNNLLDGDNTVSGINLLQQTIGKEASDFDSTCRAEALTYSFASDANLDDSITVLLEPGVYTITKTLTVNKQAMEFYADVFVRNNTCIKTLDEFKTEYLEATDFSGCEMTCDECVTQLGDRSTFIAEQVALLVEDSITVTGADSTYLDLLYDSLVTTCLEPCRELAPCEIKLSILKVDMTPSGQYALLSDNGYFADSSTLNIESFEYGGNYRYKKVGTTQVKMQYTDGNGNLDSVLYDDVMTAAADLPYDAFITYFKDSWADSLIQFHPEYCNYEWCVLNEASFLYDQRITNTPTYAEAYDSGYLNPMLMPLAGYGGTDLDPYFGSAWGSNDSNAIKNTLSNFKTEGSTTYSAWQIPLIVFHCDEETTESGINTCLSGLTMSNPSCAPEQDAMWRMFRSLYLAEKAKLMEARMSSEVTCASASLIKQQRFFDTDDAENLSATTGASTAAEATDSLNTQCATTCAAYVEIWMYKLRGCSLTASDSLALADSLVNICTYGCDVNNPLGASSVAPQYQTGNTPGYKTFQEAVKNIATLVPGVCDANLISFPMEFNHDYFATDNPNADTCACNTLTVEDSDTTCACAETNDSLRIHLLAGIEIPEESKCKTCVNCEELAMALGQLDTTYNLIITDTTVGLRNVLETGLNKILSFNYSYDDYIDFMSECLGDTTIQDSTLLKFRDKFRYYILSPLSEGEEEAMEGGEGGMGAAFFNPPPAMMGGSGLSPVDTCACNLLLDIKKKFDLLNPPMSYNDFYVQEINARGLSCESAGLNYEYIMTKCRDAYEMDDERLPFDTTKGWSKTQRYNLHFIVDDYELEFPDGCVCQSPPALPEDTTAAIPCDSLMKIWVWRRQIFERTRQYLDTNFMMSDSTAYQSSVDSAWDNFQEPYDYFNDASFDFDAEYERYKRIYCGGGSTGGISCLDCPPRIPPFCDNCYVLDDSLKQLTLDFLNQLKTVYKSNNHLVRDKWLLLPTGNAYSNAKFYTGSNSADLKYKILYWEPFSSPELTFQIGDGNGHASVWNLALPALHRFYQFGYIVEFSDLIPQYPSTCENNSNTFIVKAMVKKPTRFGGDTIAVEYIHGTVSNLLFYEEDTVCEAKIYRCNKPLMYVQQDTGDCRTSLTLLAHHNAEIAYRQYIDSVKKAFRAQYVANCMEARKTETFTMRYSIQEYHYTLYYYDQAGNLVQTVPPAGVNMLPQSSWASVQNVRKNGGSPVLPSHTFITKYNFNTLNQLAQQSTPDGGESHFWYDAVGRLVVSRNAKQNAQATKEYSYTLFDALGRITEVGQLASSTAMTVAKAFDPTDLQTWLDNANSTKEEITRTYYDNVAIAGVQNEFTGGQQYLRKRVVSTTYSTTNDGSYQHGVHYTYDVHGYVNTIVREAVALDAAGHRYKRIDYQYDLLSGNVHQVRYQQGETDRFYHRYTYDADNRITHAYTSTDGVTWDNDAAYQYYRHGPLMRAEIGELKVQGTDYAYTIQGWLKGVNSNTLYANRDIGQDGYNTGARPWVAKDVFGFSLGYYEGDYTQVGSITTANHFLAEVGSSSVFNAASDNLYNGNIRHMVTTVSVLSSGAPLGSAYRYDQLNRIAKAEYYTNIDEGNNEWETTGSALAAYRNTFTYDANGNILTQNRHGGATTPNMDSMTYHYQSGTNKLTYVDDVVSSSNYADDIDDQSSGNYTYDEIGNMISDAAEEIQTIEWTVYGKIKKITRTGASSKPNLEFEYSPDGHRVMKKVIPATGNTVTTWYTRDAQGNTMAIYEEEQDTVILEELGIFGSSRLGMVKPDLNLNTAILDTTHYQLKRGQKRYEMSNHLGNVLAVVNDKLDVVCEGDTVSYFNAEVLYAYDYSPFGAILEDRKYVADTNCTTTIDYDTAYNDHYEVTFTLTTMLAPGETIRLDNGGGTTKTLATYNAGYVSVFSYKGQIISNVSPAADGIMYIPQTGATVKLRFSADSLGFSCGDVVYVYSGATSLTSVTIDCAIDSIYAVDTIVSCSSSDYRFGFNGQEKDNEVSGDGNSMTAEFWQYDSRLGRRFNLDPKGHPSISFYACFANNPIWYSDPYGDTVKLSSAFKKNKLAMEKYNIFKNSKEGKAFLKTYGVGGDRQNISVIFDLKDLGGSGNTETYIFDKTKDSQTKIGGGLYNTNDHNDKNAKNIINGNVKDKFIRFHINLAIDENISNKANNGKFRVLENSLTLLHETQHLLITHYSLKENGTIPSRNSQHNKMKRKDGILFQQRVSFLKQNRKYWFEHYNSVKKKYRSEQDFLEQKANNFIN